MDLVEHMESSDDMDERDGAKVINVVHTAVKDCRAVADPYKQAVCSVATAFIALATYIAEGVLVVSAQDRATYAATMAGNIMFREFVVIACKGLYQLDELKAKVTQILPAVKELVKDKVDTLLEYGSIAMELSEEEEPITQIQPPVQQPTVVAPASATPKALEEVHHYIELAIDNLEQAYKSLKSISRRFKVGVAFVTIIWLLVDLYWWSWAASAGYVNYTGSPSLPWLILSFLILLAIGPFFLGIFVWFAIGINLAYAWRFSHRAKIVKKNIDALRGVEPHSFSPKILNAISAELQVLQPRLGIAVSGKVLEASQQIEDALYYLQKAAEMLAGRA